MYLLPNLVIPIGGPTVWYQPKQHRSPHRLFLLYSELLEQLFLTLLLVHYLDLLLLFVCVDV